MKSLLKSGNVTEFDNPTPRAPPAAKINNPNPLLLVLLVLLLVLLVLLVLLSSPHGKAGSAGKHHYSCYTSIEFGDLVKRFPKSFYSLRSASIQPAVLSHSSRREFSSPWCLINWDLVTMFIGFESSTSFPARRAGSRVYFQHRCSASVFLIFFY